MDELSLGDGGWYAPTSKKKEISLLSAISADIVYINDRLVVIMDISVISKGDCTFITPEFSIMDITSEGA